MVSASGVPLPVATIRAYRKTGGAVITVERQGRPPHRYRVSLRRYHALREWTIRQHEWKTSGAYMRSSMAVSLWTTREPVPAGKEVNDTQDRVTISGLGRWNQHRSRPDQTHYIGVNMADGNLTGSSDIGNLDYVTVTNRLNNERVRLRNGTSSLLVAITVLEQENPNVPTSNVTEALWLIHETLESVIERLDENRVLAPTKDAEGAS